ncbi:hypothetical protein NN561_001683 [Cricetulus griseus]
MRSPPAPRRQHPSRASRLLHSRQPLRALGIACPCPQRPHLPRAPSPVRLPRATRDRAVLDPAAVTQRSHVCAPPGAAPSPMHPSRTHLQREPAGQRVPGGQRLQATVPSRSSARSCVWTGDASRAPAGRRGGRLRGGQTELALHSTARGPPQPRGATLPPSPGVPKPEPSVPAPLRAPAAYRVLRLPAARELGEQRLCRARDGAGDEQCPQGAGARPLHFLWASLRESLPEESGGSERTPAHTWRAPKARAGRGCLEKANLGCS